MISLCATGPTCARTTESDRMTTPAPLDSRILFRLALAGSMSAASLRVCDAMLPALASDFGGNVAQMAGVITVFTIAYSIAQLFFGGLGDRYGKVTVISVCCFAAAVCSLGAAAAPGYHSLLILRALAGMTFAGVMPLAMAHVGDVVPYSQRQATLAQIMVGTVLGFTAGQFMGGFLAETVGWRIAFVILAAGSLFASLGLREAASRPTTPSPAPGGHVAFWRHYVAVLRHGWARVILILVAMEALMLFGALAFIPSHLHAHYGLSLTVAGSVGLFYGAGALAYTAIARRAIGYLGEVRLALCGGLLMGLALIAIGLQLSWMIAYPASFVVGLGYYMLHGALQTHATQMAPEARGTAVALFSLALFSGQSIGVAAGASTLQQLGAEWLYLAAGVGLLAVALVFGYLVTRRSHS